jgi:hypothetical protein
MYFKIGSDGNMVIIVLYVDDLLLVDDCKHEVELIKHKLMEVFEMTNLGKVKLYIGIEQCIFLVV